MKYDFTAIEKRWQTYWSEHKTFKTPNPGDEGFDPDRQPYYVLDMFPYPSGVGLHVGHPLGYIATDIVARYKRMRGFNVLHPMGYDAFGLPAEQFAVEHGVHPRITTEQNIANMDRQLQQLGMSYDWDRKIATIDVDYYKWTQWIFLQLFHSWFDPAANKARPISELVELLENEQLLVSISGELVSPAPEGLDAVTGTPFGASKWHELSADQQREVIENHRLAYMDEVAVNWCPALGTVLANEEVTNEGRSERGNYPVYKRPLRQWMMRITAYAERLLDDLDEVDWPESIKLLQRNWIGRSEGARVDFPIADEADQPSDESITVFTTRPDTLFGATYMVLAPEHELVDAITTPPQQAAVQAYRKQAASRSEIDRQAENREKTGVFTGSYAINPVNDRKIPIWIADYVLMGYGTGAIMAVPAHDQRDFEFAKQFGLPIIPVLTPPEQWLNRFAGSIDNGAESSPEELELAYLEDPAQLPEAFCDVGESINSANSEVSLDGHPTPEAKRIITAWLEEKGIGRGMVQYKLRDWLFSRQRYWGEPFPILHGPDGEVRGVPEPDLPVELPDMENFTPHASEDPNAPVQTPLSRAPESWRKVEIDGELYERELNTMPQWAGSCWYYLRFLDPANSKQMVNPDVEQYWMNGGDVPGVDLYVGGVEHAVLHLLYARFWHKALYDLGYVSTSEPFGRLFSQGYIQAYAYTDERGVYVPAADVVNEEGKPAFEVQGQPGQQFLHEGRPVTERYGKMGKSLKNAIAPDDICETYGADTLRLYEMYMGPLDQSKPWNARDIVGVHRFLQRLWRNFVDDETGDWKVVNDPAPDDMRKALHRTIKRVSECMESMSFNVAIAALIELNNRQVTRERLEREVAKPLITMLAPFAPHVAEELWERLGHADSIAYRPWPDYDEALLVEDRIEIPVQVNGKLRGRITVAADADDATIEAAAKAQENVAASIADKTVRKIIVVQRKLVNVVVS